MVSLPDIVQEAERATEVCKVLLKQIVPRFGLPQSLQSNNGSSFTATTSQNLAPCLRIKYRLHSFWRPQTSGKVPRAKQTLKRALAKLCQETIMLLLLSCFSRADSLGTHRQQPTSLPHPWDSPGRNTGVGCHFLLQCMKVKSERKSLSQSGSERDGCSQPPSRQPSRMTGRSSWKAFLWRLCFSAHPRLLRWVTPGRRAEPGSVQGPYRLAPRDTQGLDPLLECRVS